MVYIYADKYCFPDLFVWTEGGKYRKYSRVPFKSTIYEELLVVWLGVAGMVSETT